MPTGEKKIKQERRSNFHIKKPPFAETKGCAFSFAVGGVSVRVDRGGLDLAVRRTQQKERIPSHHVCFVLHE